MSNQEKKEDCCCCNCPPASLDKLASALRQIAEAIEHCNPSSKR